MSEEHKPLHCAAEPCLSCPYRKDHPSGVWHMREYEKLRGFDDFPGTIATFHCHQENASGIPTVCRGWLTVHAESVAVIVAAQYYGSVTQEQIYAPVQTELYASGNEAADAGCERLLCPDGDALKMASKLIVRGVAFDKRTAKENEE